MDLYFIAGKRTVQEKETYRKTASFLGSAGASLVDLDNLFSSHTKPKQRPLDNKLATQTHAIGKDRNDASLWVKMPFLTKVLCGIVCGALDSNGCMVIVQMLKIINSPVTLQVHSTAAQLKSSERDREGVGTV